MGKENDLGPPNEIFLGNKTDMAAAVIRIVSIIPHHEIVAGGNLE